MSTALSEIEALRTRRAPHAMSAEAFRVVGHRLIDDISEGLARIPSGPVTRSESLADVRRALGSGRSLPDTGADAGTLMREATALLFEHALFNGHPSFFGYITSSPAPIGMLADCLAASLNQNVGAWELSPLASEIEAQAVRWVAELIGFPATGGGLMVSGGNMANVVGLLAARAAKAPRVRTEGMASGWPQLLVYASRDTHTWLQKATDISGLGTDAIRWVATDGEHRMDVAALRRTIDEDQGRGHQPFLVVGNAGTVSTGAVDPLREIAAVCAEHGLWFHVDGAYGAMAARVPGTPADLGALALADSVAVDPHKWLYVPLEAGCVLVRDAEALRRTFAYHPSYYHFDEQGVNYHEYGPQNSRGFRALKVWLSLQQAGRQGCLASIEDDTRLAAHLHRAVGAHPDLQSRTYRLSIVTFRYVPKDLRSQVGVETVERYLDELNTALLTALNRSGEAYLSSAVVDGRFALRACVVNFHTSLDQIEALPPLVVRLGEQADSALRGSITGQ